jgi:hypothetical protein
VLTAFVVLVATGGYLAVRQLDGVRLKLPNSHACLVEADGRVELDAEQMANAATIAAVGFSRRLPAQAVVVALATAMQESKLHNLPAGDRDSIGLFQQRPSQGWGTPEQIADPRYAAGRFYDSLVKVRGWQQLRVTDAAQAVQRSAHPEAYQRWGADSQVLSRALAGAASRAVACVVAGEPAQRGQAASAGLAAGLRLDWGAARPRASEQFPGVSVPVASEQAGWQYAHWLVAHATAHGVRLVRFGQLEWRAKDGGWVAATVDAATPPGGATSAQVIAEVYADS